MIRFAPVTAICWRPGMACLVWADYPAHVVSTCPLGRTIRVRFVGGDGPLEFGAEATVTPDVLTRPYQPLRLDRKKRVNDSCRSWRSEDLQRLRATWPLLPRSETAHRLGRTERTCQKVYYCWWGPLPRRTNLYTLQDVGRILGCDHMIVWRYIRAGYLRGQRYSAYRLPNAWVVTREELERFLRQERQHYDPARVTGDRWRAIVAQHEAADPWLSVVEVSERIGHCPDWIYRGIRSGDFPGLYGRLGGVRAYRIPDRWLRLPARQLRHCRSCKSTMPRALFKSYAESGAVLPSECRRCFNRNARLRRIARQEKAS